MRTSPYGSQPVRADSLAPFGNSGVILTATQPDRTQDATDYPWSRGTNAAQRRSALRTRQVAQETFENTGRFSPPYPQLYGRRRQTRAPYYRRGTREKNASTCTKIRRIFGIM